MTVTTKEMAEHCLRYVKPCCFQAGLDRTEVLTHLARLIKAEINLAEGNDPNRNK